MSVECMAFERDWKQETKFESLAAKQLDIYYK